MFSYAHGVELCPPSHPGYDFAVSDSGKTIRVSCKKLGASGGERAFLAQARLIYRHVRAVQRLRSRAAGSTLYRAWSRAAAVFIVLTFMHLLTDMDLLPDKPRWEPLPDSPTKETILALAKAATATDYNLFARLPVYVILFVLAWPAFQAVRCAVLRPYEGRADFVGVQVLVRRKLITPEDAKSALIKMHEANGTDPDPAWLSKLLFYDHPTLAERPRNIDEAVNGLEVETARK